MSKNMVWVVYAVYSSRGDENEHMIGVWNTANNEAVKDAAWAEFKKITRCGDADREESEFHDEIDEHIGYCNDEIFVYFKQAEYHEL